MTFEHLTSRMALDASDYSSGADEAADASEDVSGATGEMSDSLWDIEPAGLAAGGALAGIGTAGQRVLDDTRETRESLDRTAETMGITSDAARDLATDMSDATFDLDDVEGTMDSLSEMGIDSADDMEELGLQMDEIADATGNTAEGVTDAVGPALRAMGEDVEDVGEHADTFTHIAENTTMELDDFSQMTTKLGPELEDMEMGVDDTAAVMGALEERGLDSRTAMSEFRQATDEADGDQEELMESLGVTSEELDEQHDALADAEGMTEDHAEAANSNVSTMDELRASLGDAQLAAANYLGPLESLMPAAQAAGIALMGMSTINLTAVAPSFAAVSAAAAPITAVVLGLAAAVTAAYVIWERDLGGIQDKTKTASEVVTGAIGGVVDFVGDAFETIDYILTDWDPAETVDNATDEVMDIFTDWHPAGIVWDKRDEIMEAGRDIRDGLEERVTEAVDRGTDVFFDWHPAGVVYDKREEIMDALPVPEDWRERGEELVDAFTDGVTDMVPDVEGAVEGLADAAGEYLPSSDADKGPLSNLTDRGGSIPETLAEGVRANAHELEESVDEMAADAVQGLSLRDAEDQLDQDIDDIETQLSELEDEYGETGDDEIAEEIEARESDLEDLLEQREEVEDADSIADVDEDLLAGVALDAAEQEAREEETLAGVESIVEAELETVADPEPEAEYGAGDYHRSPGGSGDSSSTDSDSSTESGQTTAGTDDEVVSLLEMVLEEIRALAAGQELELSGSLEIDGDVATMDDVDARLRTDARRNRGSRS